jgi:hypothetical protein
MTRPGAPLRGAFFVCAGGFGRPFHLARHSAILDRAAGDVGLRTLLAGILGAASAALFHNRPMTVTKDVMLIDFLTLVLVALGVVFVGWVVLYLAAKIRHP